MQLFLEIDLEVADMFHKINPFAGKNESSSWWWFGIKVGIVTALVVWWWLDQQSKKQSQSSLGSGSLSEGKSILLPEESPPAQTTLPVPHKPDDLRKIEGIGPKFQATLQAAGIQTYAQLAAMKPAELKQILVDASIRLGDPTTWPEQAALAAAGDWDQLKALQSTLKGGRRE
jgi:predicted flap endonuclease-1-like 5' DNA nuclease